MLTGAVKTNGEVSDRTEDNWQADTVRKLREDLGPEIGGNIVHVVVDFSQEDGTLLWEDQDDILDSNKEGIHSHEEKRTLNVLPTSRSCKFGVPEQNTDEDTSTNGGKELHVGGLGQTDDVVKVSSGKKLPLEAPRLHGLSSSSINHFGEWVFETSIVAKVRVNVLVVEMFNTFLISIENILFLLLFSNSVFRLSTFLLDSFFVHNNLFTVLLLILNFSDNRLSRHDVHEVISRVAITGARETDGLEVVDGELRVVVVDDLTTSDEEELIELIKSLSVRLMDS